jgi:hypothetical protein
MSDIYLGNNLEEKINFIGKQVNDALNVLLDRTIKAKNEGEIKAKENKEKLSDSGILQNCEFGMILNEGVFWLKSHNCLSGRLKDVNIVEDVIITLLEKTIKRAIDRKNEDDGGRGEKDLVFFSGQPYTEYKKKGQTYYASNLDAAMIMVSFIASSLTHFNDIIAGKEIKFESSEIPKWIKTLRDASIFIIYEGLKYAQRCKVYVQNTFAGFTCDPTSNVPIQEEGGLDEFDRLFFTWTAAETIYDMIKLKDRYLKKIQGDYQEEEGAKALIKLIDSLDGTLYESSIWVEQSFYSGFEKIKDKLKGRNVKDIVNEIQEVGDRPLNESQKKLISILEQYIPFVYHISQYAAVRSLSEKADIDKEEIEMIPILLKELVIEDIINSNLDKATQRDLYNSLTRRYDLGKSGPEDYQDDAYYPLVVRSTASLLIRTINIIKEEISREKSLDLIENYSEILDIHVKNLLKRRPQKMEEGDECLWSYALDKEYVLYATQRTIFALLRFGDFLKAADEFKRTEISSESIKTILRNKFAQSIAETLLSDETINSLLMVSRASENVIKDSSQLLLPEPEWAMGVIRDWLKVFVNDFNESRVEEILNDRINKLIFYLDFFSSKESNIPDDLQDNDSLKKIQSNAVKEKENILKMCPEIGEMKGDWDKSGLVKILFKNIFCEFINNTETSFKKFLENDTAQILKTIIGADQAREIFVRAVDKAIKKKNK